MLFSELYIVIFPLSLFLFDYMEMKVFLLNLLLILWISLLDLLGLKLHNFAFFVIKSTGDVKLMKIVVN